MQSHQASVLFAFVLVTGLALTAPTFAENEATAIYTMNVDGSQVKKLVRVGGYSEHASPRWSHDGRRVAFDGLPIGGGARMMFVVNADGSGLREVGPGSMPAWSPDDKQFACHFWPQAGRSQLFAVNADGQGRSELGLGNSPQWSPDGGQLATTDGKNLFVIDQVTGERGQLFDQPYFEVFKGFRFSPDGRRVAVAVRPVQNGQRQLLLVNVDGAAQAPQKRLSNNLGGFVSFSPDGRRLAFATDERIHVVDVDGTGNSRLVPGQKGKNRNPDWSPDGKQLVFVSDRDTKK